MSIVFVVSAPSGTGKSTLVRRLLDRDRKLEFATSVTTRPRRSSEVDGREYLFVSEERFFAMRGAGDLLEWAEVFGHYYGTPRSGLEDALARGQDVVLDIDVQGASSLKETLPEAVRVYVLPPAREALEQRLTARSSDARPVIERRLGEAAREVANFSSYDYVIVNRNIDESVDALHSIVIAERSRTARMETAIGPILASFGIEPSRGTEGDE